MSAPKIAVVDSGVANFSSVTAALARLGAEAEITSDSARIRNAERVIVPGVGAAAAAMAYLNGKNLIETLRELTQPVLGICLGMQVLFEKSLEGDKGPVTCLGLLKGEVKPLPASPQMPIPHMGWNSLDFAKPEHALLRGVTPGSHVYFVHSYAVDTSNMTIASADYGHVFTAMAGARNFFGCQFHPEKSGTVGSTIIENFLRM